MTIRVIRAGEHVQHIPGWGMTVRESGVAVAAASNWWAVPGKMCVAAYQPKGAADYATSKVNLANPGTYNAADGALAPDWGTAIGWDFSNGNSSLNTGFGLTTQDLSVFVRFSDVTSGDAKSLFGGQLGGGYQNFSIEPKFYTYGVNYNNSSTVYQNHPTAAMLSGIAGISGLKCWRNSVHVKTLASGTTASTRDIHIGNKNGSSAYISAYIQAIVFYNTTITDEQVSALYTAMNAL